MGERWDRERHASWDSNSGRLTAFFKKKKKTQEVVKMSRVPNVETKAIHFRTKILDSAY